MTKERTSARGRAGPTVRDSCERIGVKLSNLLRTLAPSDEVRAHFRAAQVELLKGVRAAIDARIERVTQDRQKGKSVTIE